MRKFLRVSLCGLAAGALLYVAAALALILWPDAPFDGIPRPTVAQMAAGEAASGVDRSQSFAFRARRFAARDGTALFARAFDAPPGATILLLHGVASDSSALNRAAGLLREASGARVIALDFRGHGRSGGKRWSVDHQGQYDEDVADVVARLRKERPQDKLILAGHSMGGGIALRYALDESAPPVDGYLLIAPNLGSDAPTARKPASDAEARAAEAFVHFRTPRLIGAAMLDAVGIRAFGDLPILSFNTPEAPAYGFDAILSMQPDARGEDYRAAFRAIAGPLLVIAGSADEAFRAEGFRQVVEAESAGKAVLVDGASHNGVLQDPRTFAAIADWAADAGLDARR